MKEEFESACEEYLTAKEQSEYWRRRMTAARQKLESLHELYQVESVKDSDETKPWTTATPRMEVRIEKGREQEFLRWLEETGRSDAIKRSVSKDQLKEIVVPLIESGQDVPFVKTYNNMTVRVYKRGWKSPQENQNG